MPSNDRIVLDEVLRQRQGDVDPSSSASDFFELFTVEQILKDNDLSYDELEAGLVGDGGDGGVDGIFVFVNGELVQDETDFGQLKKNIVLDLVIVQAKTSAGFAETPVERFITVSDDILDLSRPLASLATTYNPRLLEAIARFRNAHKQLASTFPLLRIAYHYATKGATPEPNIVRKVDKLKSLVKGHFPSADCEFSFVGATELLALARRSPRTTYTLTLAENSISPPGQVAFVCLVALRDFFAFITDSSGALLRQLFESNVRDYQGRTEVNDWIQQSLTDRAPEDFWWLNNGVTIVASRASQSGKTLTIEDPQIVNGLQSSTEIYNYFKTSNTTDDERRLLVRVVVPTEAAIRDRVIKATNSQTAVSPASLRATDVIHRNIEELMRPHGLFYDRRKNFYKNEGKPRDKIIGIPLLAQAVMAIVLQRPDTARARPSSLLKSDENYSRVYSPSYPVSVFWVCAEIIRRVEAYLRGVGTLTGSERNNLRFYVAMHVAALAVGAARPSPQQLAEMDTSRVSDALLAESVAEILHAYRDKGGDDQAAKGSAMLEAVREGLTLRFP